MNPLENGLGKLEVKQLLLSGIEELCNRALQYDEASCLAFEELSGASIFVESKLPVIQADFNFYILFCDNGIILSSQYEHEADAEIHAANFQTVARFLSGRSALGRKNEGRLMIHGDLELVDTFQNILTELEIDWEEPLSQYTGDIVAHEVHRMVNDAGKLIKKASDFIENDLEDALNNISERFFKTRKPFRPQKRSVSTAGNKSSARKESKDIKSFEDEITEIESMQQQAEEALSKINLNDAGQAGTGKQ